MELTLADIKELVGAPQGESILARYVGTDVFVRTVTHHYTGHLVVCDGQVMKLRDAAWIADSGRWADALKNGKLNEVEPFPGEVLVSVGALVDVSPWNHPLPKVQK